MVTPVPGEEKIPTLGKRSNKKVPKQDRMVTPVPEKEDIPTPPQKRMYKKEMPQKDGMKTSPEVENTSNSMAQEQDRMVTQIPSAEEVPTPSQMGKYDNKAPRKEGMTMVPVGKDTTHCLEQKKERMVTQRPEITKKKTTLLPPRKEDNPKAVRQYKKKKGEHSIDPNQKKISNMFRPKVKTTSNTVDQTTSNINIYMKDNNFEDDLVFEDNLGCTTNSRSCEGSRPQTPKQPEKQFLEKFLEGSKFQTMNAAPDLAVSRLAGKTLISQISNQHLAGGSWRPNDRKDQVETSDNSGKGSISQSLT